MRIGSQTTSWPLGSFSVLSLIFVCNSEGSLESLSRTCWSATSGPSTSPESRRFSSLNFRFSPTRGCHTKTCYSCPWFNVCISQSSWAFYKYWRSFFLTLALRVALSLSMLPFECSLTFIFPLVAHLDPAGRFNSSNSHSPRVFNISLGRLKFSSNRSEYCTILILWHSSAGFWHLQDSSIFQFQFFMYGFNSFQQLCIFLSSLLSFWLHRSLLAGFWCCLGVLDIDFCPGAGLFDVQFWVRWHFLVQQEPTTRSPSELCKPNAHKGLIKAL